MKSFRIGTIYNIAIYSLFIICAALLFIIRPETPFEQIFEKMGHGYDIIVILIFWSPLVLWLDYINTTKLQTETNKNSIPNFILIVLLSVMLIGTYHDIRTGINQTSAFVIIAIITGLIIKSYNKPRTYAWLYFAYFAVMVISLIWSNNKSYGIYILIHRSTLWATMPIAFCFINTKGYKDILLTLCFRASLLFVLLSLLVWIYQTIQLGCGFPIWWAAGKHIIINDRWPYQIIFSWLDYYHPSYNGIGVIFGFISALYLLKTKKVHIIEVILFFLLSTFLFWILQSRICVLMLIITAFLSPLIFAQTNKQRIVIAIISASLCLLVIYALYYSFGIYFHLDSNRSYLYSTAIKCIKQMPILGTGLGGMNSDLIEQLTGESFKLPQYFHPHNQFLGDWWQLGILGLITLLSIICYLIYKSIKENNYVLFIFLLNMMLFMLIEMPFFNIKGNTFFVCFTCLLLSEYQNEQ